MSTHQRNSTPEELLQLRAAFVHAFPNCFAPKGATKRPLKIGIYNDLRGRGRSVFPALTNRMIKAFIHDYCSGHNYLVTCRSGAVRVDLDGNFCGFVTADEAAYAENCLAAIKAKKKPQKRRSGPAVSSIGSAAKRAVRTISPVSELDKAKADLLRLEEADFAASMSDNHYATSGRMREMQMQIAAAKDRVKELEGKK